MARFLVRRALLLLITLWIVSVLVFGLSRVRGDPRVMYLDFTTSHETWEAWGREMGLDKPVVVQYLIWAGKAVRGDFGDSLWERKPVTTVVAERLPTTITLALAALLLAGIGIPLGVFSAVRRGSCWDYLSRAFAVTGQTVPSFFLGIALILIFSVKFHWLPAGKTGGLSHFILPAITLGWYPAASIMRLVRSSMLEVLDEEYVKLARAKGVSAAGIIWKHALKNALTAPLTYGGLLLGALFTGAVVTESVFGWPGIGSLAVNAILQNDFPLLAALVLYFAVLFVATNLLVDLLYVYIDPRVRLY